MRYTPIALAIAALLAPPTLGPAAAQDETETQPPQVTIEQVEIDPAAPAADTLCKLKVTLKNHGSEVASQLDFKVSINGTELPVYRNQLFMYPLEPGKAAELKLYNFWSTETSRPMPPDGKLTVEVSLVGAQWTKISMEDDVEVWEPLGEVPGLPHSRSVTLEMKR